MPEPGDLETAFATFSQQRIAAVFVGTSTFFNRRMEQVAALAARHALPVLTGSDGTAIDFIREHRVRSAKNRQRHNL